MALPTDITNLNLWIKGDAGIFTDTARTTPVTADSQGIAGWQDYSGAANHISTATSAQRMKADVTRGLAHCEITGDQYLNLPAAYPINAQSFSAFFILDLVTLRKGSNSAVIGTNHVLLNTVGNICNIYYDRDSVKIYAGAFVTFSLKPHTSRILFGISAGASGVTLYVNESSQTLSALAAGSNTGGTIFDSINSNTNAGVRDVMFYNRALTSGEAATLLSYAQDRGVTRNDAHTGNVIFDGDSITAGSLSTLNQSWPRQVTIPATVRRNSIAEPSITLQTLVSEAATFVDTRILAGQTNALCVFAGTNDIYNSGRTAVQVYNDLKTYINARVVAGIPANRIIVGTMLPRGGASESIRQAYNTAIRGDATAIGYIVADCGADATIGDDGDQLNTTYYADAIHPTTAGYAIIASYFDARLDAFFGAIHACNGTATGTAGATGAPRLIRTLVGVAVGTATTTARGVRIQPLRSTATGTADTIAAARIIRLLSGTATGAALSTATAKMLYRVTGSATGTATATALATLPGARAGLITASDVLRVVFRVSSGVRTVMTTHDENAGT